MLRSARNIFRLLRIARTMARHNALPDELSGVSPAISFLWRRFARKDVPGRPGQRLALALTELGPTYIKLGQLLSTRSDLVGERMAADLAQLQDRLPPFPGHQARAILEDELGVPVSQSFVSFDDVPIAAASIAQVHFAVTPDGEEVAVKILRPGIEAIFERDIDLFFWLAEWAERLLPALNRLHPQEVVQIFARTSRLEMDLRMEASAAAELAGNFKGQSTFKVPRILWERTARRILTLERIRGIKIDEQERIDAAGLDRDAVLGVAAAAFFNQVFRDGFFHADLHPGNMFIHEDGTISVIDFGIMGRLDRDTRYYLADMLIGFLTGDYRRVAQVHFDAGWVPKNQSIELFTQACRAIGEPLQNKPLAEISVGRLLSQLFAVTEQFNMHTQPKLVLLQKSMLTAEGVSRLLNPHVNMWEVTRPLIEAWVRENRGPEAVIINDIGAGISILRRLPSLIEQADRVTSQMAENGVRLHPDTVDQLDAKRARRNRGQGLALWAIVALLAVIAVQLG